MKATTIRIALGAMLLFSACASMDKVMTGANRKPDEATRRTLVAQYPDLTAAQKASFVAGDPWIGMTEAQLKTLMGGDAVKNQRKLSAAGNDDIQIYAVLYPGAGPLGGSLTKYYKAKVHEGKLAEFQEVDKYAGDLEKL